MENRFAVVLVERLRTVNIFHTNKAGLFYKCFPDRTMTFKNEKCHGAEHRKKKKKNNFISGEYVRDGKFRLANLQEGVSPF